MLEKRNNLCYKNKVIIINIWHRYEMTKSLYSAVLLGIVLCSSSCGYAPRDRVLSGAGLGAATGAVGSAIVGGSVGTGLLLGTAAGAIMGGVTDQQELDLGRPFWR
jgi:outer membrane lipoprotein SlyB